MVSAPAVSSDGSTVFIGPGDGSVYALSAIDGSMQWSYKTGAKGGYNFVDSSPVLSSDESVLYVGSNDNNVYALSTGL
jgi:outer membrane protein assembly factor BamB